MRVGQLLAENANLVAGIDGHWAGGFKLDAGISIHFSEKERPYTGPELRPHFLLTELGVRGSALAAFVGPCEVKTEHLVDWEDRLVSDFIRAKRMVHFLGEFFGMTLREGVLVQRWLVAKAAEELSTELRDLGSAARIRRDGDDLFVTVPGKAERKLTVSIVTASPVSILLHLGVNIDPTGAPVAAVGLAELGIDASKWTARFLELFQQEWVGINWACAKVRPVV